ncbi:MAG: hypothetical protein EOM06_01060 [Sphingobacteriia bacterium]|nr:hypothetical protein [Sphingobacteriia bacterium]
MNFRIIIAFLLLSLFQSAIAQNTPEPVRIEIESNAEVFQLIPCGETGVLVFYETISQPDPQNNTWFFIFYNNRLEPVWSREIPVITNALYQGRFIQDENIFIAFQQINRKKTAEYNFQVISLNASNADMISVNTGVPDKAELIRFTITGEKLIAGFNLNNDRAFLLNKDLISGEEIRTDFSDRPSFIKDVKSIPDLNRIMVSLNIYISRRESTTYLNTYDFSGNLVHSLPLTPSQPTEKLLNAQLHFLEGDNLYLLGSYNNLNGKTARAEDTYQSELSEGFFIAKVSGNEQKFLRTHSLASFENITQILNNQQLASAGSILKKQAKKGKEQSLNYDFLIHDLIVHNNEFILLADAYYPEYRQISSLSYDFYGRPMPYYYTIFDGYRYFNAFVVGFDKEGNLLWSNGMKIWDIQSMQLSRKTAFHIDGSDMVLFYNHNGQIVSKMFDGIRDVGGTENTKIATSFPGDLQIEASQGVVSHWYDNYFLASGYQTLQNSKSGSKNRRTIFYMNKIIFD